MIDTDRLRDILFDCLFVDQAELDSSPSLSAEGVIQSYQFHEGRYRTHESEIIEMIDQLNDTLFAKGGTSFLDMPVDKNGDHWGEHNSCEMLLVLAIAGGHARFVFGRPMWRAFPGGMPIVEFTRATPTTKQ